MKRRLGRRSPENAEFWTYLEIRRVRCRLISWAPAKSGSAREASGRQKGRRVGRRPRDAQSAGPEPRPAEPARAASGGSKFPRFHVSHNAEVILTPPHVAGFGMVAVAGGGRVRAEAAGSPVTYTQRTRTPDGYAITTRESGGPCQPGKLRKELLNLGYFLAAGETGVAGFERRPHRHLNGHIHWRVRPCAFLRVVEVPAPSACISLSRTMSCTGNSWPCATPAAA